MSVQPVTPPGDRPFRHRIANPQSVRLSAPDLVTAPDSINLPPGVVWEDPPTDNAKDAEIKRLHDVIALKDRELAEIATASIAADRDRDRLDRELAAAISEQDRIAADLRKALAANQKWAETLSDVQLRHAGVKRERDEAREELATSRAELRQAAMIADNRAASLKAANQGWTEASRERDEACSDASRLRVLVGDILAALGPRPNGISDPQVAKWRKRAEKRS